MIGRVDGIFSTYSSHDISHVEAMLNMLEWLIPPETKSKMTSVEWLLTVLSFYFHDLGMVVSSAEYEHRMDNTSFCTFIDELETKSENRDYLDRLQKIPPEEKDEFLYQEFVRSQHSQRIREWIIGEGNLSWGDTLKPISNEISLILQNIPSRFKRNLADLCESHHNENLDDRSYLPLCQHYGEPKAVANIQYVALLLRTADLLHITKDRTPSLMFHTLKISDPMGVDEWKKQMGTFSVNMKSRQFHPDDLDSHVIVISSDFEEERPFFVLTEYIAYANEQIEQTYRCAKKSQQESDAKYYSFPWRQIEGDIRVEGNEPYPMRFEFDRGRLLNLLVGHTIYNDPTVAIRELLQNGIDAIRYQSYLDKKNLNSISQELDCGEVNVKWNSDKRELIVQDNGIGMDLDIIRYHLMKVGASFYDTTSFQSESPDFIPISRFGIGILTCFMISDNIEIITSKGGKGYRIRMSSVKADYLLKTLNEGDFSLNELGEHGTKVTLILRPSVNLTEKTIMDILRHWVIIPECHINYTKDDKPVQNIGFNSPADALHFYLFDSEDKTTLDPDSIDIESKKIDFEGHIYELAFAVQKSFSPERTYLTTLPESTPCTCLEGIRVDNHLPGFGKIAAILLVKNNRAFRTTVSRERLERDDEYYRVGEICVKMLFEHIGDESGRILESEGHSLLKASSAIRWLYRTLIKTIKVEKMRANLIQKYRSIPNIVIETNQLDDSKDVPNKELINLDALSEMPFFWIIESRVVDYLSIISRDLGRELSLNQFLAGVAPDLYDPNLNPIISDAHHFKKYIATTHKVELAQFSKIHQRTAIKWIKREIPFISRKLSKKEFEYYNKLSEKYKLRDEFSLYKDIFSNYYIDDIFDGNIEGDIPEVKYIRTRGGIILSKDSVCAHLWNEVAKAIQQLNEDAMMHERLLLLIISVFIRNSFFQSYYFRNSEDSQDTWGKLLSGIEKNTVLKQLNLPFPNKVDEITDDKIRWFDAKEYWFNWDK